MILGKNVGLHYGPESTYGTAASATTKFGGKISNFSPTMDNGVEGLRGLGDGTNYAQFIYGNFNGSFSLTMDLADPTFLLHLIGPLTGDGAADATQKTLTEADNYGVTSSDVRAFTMIAGKEDGSSDVEDSYLGCVITECTISGSEEGRVTADVRGVFKTVSLDNSITTAFTPFTTTPYLGSQANYLKWGTTPTAVAKVARWSVTIRNTPFIYRSITTNGFIEQPEFDLRQYLFTIDVRESQTILSTLVANFLNDASSPYTPDARTTVTTPTNLEFQVQMGEGTGTGDRKMTIKLDECVLVDKSNSVSVGDDIVRQVFSGWATKGESNAPIIWVD